MKTIAVTGKGSTKDLCELDLTEALKRCDLVYASPTSPNRTPRSAAIADLGRFSKADIEDMLKQVRA